MIETVRPLADTDFESDLAFVDYVEVPPGASIGLHKHGDDEEIYFVIEGSGSMTIGAETHSVQAGDLIVNPRRGTHGMRNTSGHRIRLLIWQINLRQER